MMTEIYNPYELLKKYMDNVINYKEQKIQFFLLNKASETEQINKITNIVQGILGDYYINDFLHIQDFSKELGKKHNLRIKEENSSETYKTLFTEHSYRDIGTREISTRLQQSGFSNKKIVLIENIERMTIGAINSFLKTCEEPLPNRIILATTSNKSKIIDTILSRAILINFDADYLDNINDTLSKYEIFQINDALKNIVSEISIGRKDFIKKLSNIISKDPSIIDEIVQLPEYLGSKNNINKKVTLLKQFHNFGILTNILDGMIYFYTQNSQFKLAKKRLEVKKLTNTNVNLDNILFYGFVNL